MKMIRFPSFLARNPEDGAVDKQVQYAALPFVATEKGVRVCLVTSRETARWVLPKGWPKPGRPPQETAAQEAYEEAGLDGRIHDAPLGSYDYVKRLHVFFSVLCRVDVYPLEVTVQMLEWPEQPWRRLKWASPQEAAELVDEPGLAALIARFAAD